MQSRIADIAKEARSFAWRNGGVPTAVGYVIPTAAYPKFQKAMRKQNKKFAKKVRKLMRQFEVLP